MQSVADEKWMQIALSLAQKAELQDEVPVGAIIVLNDEIIAEAFNTRESQHDPLAHAEITAIREAAQKLKRWRLSDCTLYVTLEPCLMCAGAVVNARLERIVFGAHDPKAGAVESLYQTLSDSRLNHRPQITSGILADECGSILSKFFQRRRKS